MNNEYNMKSLDYFINFEINILRKVFVFTIPFFFMIALTLLSSFFKSTNYFYGIIFIIVLCVIIASFILSLFFLQHKKLFAWILLLIVNIIFILYSIELIFEISLFLLMLYEILIIEKELINIIFSFYNNGSLVLLFLTINFTLVFLWIFLSMRFLFNKKTIKIFFKNIKDVDKSGFNINIEKIDNV